MRSRIWADSGGAVVVRTDDPLHDFIKYLSFHFTDLGFSQPLHEVVLCAETGLKIDLPVLAYHCGNTSMRAIHTPYSLGMSVSLTLSMCMM